MQVGDDKFDPESSVGFWLNRASRLLLRAHEGRLKKVGLGMGHLPVLFALERGESLSQKELAERARVEQPTMAEMLARMREGGLVATKPNPEDRRGMLSSLTRTAKAGIPKAKVALLQGEADATAGFTEEEKAQLRELLKRVVKNLEGSAEP